MSDETKKIIDKRSALEKLNSGLLVQNFQREMAEPGYSAIGRITYGHVVIQKRQSYVSEIQRVLAEVEITTALTNEIEFNTTKIIDGNTIQAEDLIEYYNGIFLGLVHQAKDKLLRFLDYMAADDKIKTPYKEADKVKLSKHEELLKKIGVYGLVSDWKQEEGPIAVILKKRTQHHHFVSTTKLNSDLQNLRFSRTMLSAPAAARLNDLGKKYMENLGKESFEKYRDSITGRQSDSIIVIRNNLNGIAEKIISHFDISVDYESQAKFAAEFTEYLGSSKITNETSKDKIPSDGIIKLEDMLKLQDNLKDEVISIYGIGSYFRGDFISGSSDINMIFVTKSHKRIFDSELPVTMHIIPEDEFLSDVNKKLQFICWADGVLIHGKQHKWTKDDFPKPGTLLAMTLNEGVLDELSKQKEAILKLSSPTPVELRLIELRIVKKMMDYLFGVAISNKPMYTSNRKARLEHIKQVFGNQPLQMTIERIYLTSGLVVEPISFTQMIDAFIKSNTENYKKQIKIRDEVQES